MAMVMEVKEDLSKPVSLRKKLYGVMKRIAKFVTSKVTTKSHSNGGITRSSAASNYKSGTSKVADSKEKKECGTMKRIAKKVVTTAKKNACMTHKHKPNHKKKHEHNLSHNYKYREKEEDDGDFCVCCLNGNRRRN